MKKKTTARKPRQKPENPSEFAQFVKNFRATKNWSAADLAEAINRDKKAVVNVENDQHDLPIKFFRLLRPLLTLGQREYVEMLFQAYVVKQLRTPVEDENDKD